MKVGVLKSLMPLIFLLESCFPITPSYKIKSVHFPLETKYNPETVLVLTKRLPVVDREIILDMSDIAMSKHDGRFLEIGTQLRLMKLKRVSTMNGNFYYAECIAYLAENENMRIDYDPSYFSRMNIFK